MILYTAVLVFLLSGRVTSNCEYGRMPGLFKNSYQNSADADYVADTGSDTNDAYGNSIDVTFTKPANIFSAHSTTFTIYDTGMINFGKVTGSTVTKTGTYTGTNGPFATTLLEQSFAAPLWLQDDSADPTPIKYTFTYKLLKRSDLVASDLTTGPSMCDIQRIENIIFDCNDAGLNNRNPTGDSRISEAVIVTWKITDGSSTYYMQAVVAIDGQTTDTARETYVIFLYENPNTLPTGTNPVLTGFVNGLYSSGAQREYAAVCPFKTGAVPADITDIHTKSNCRCGSWNKGIYVFRTRDNSAATTEISNTCAKTQTDLVTQCALPLTDDHMQLPLACRPSRSLQDTCIEDIYCKQTPTANTVSVTVYLHKPRWSSFIYLDYAQLPTISLMSTGTCKRVLTESSEGQFFNTLEQTTTSLVCGFTYTAAQKTLNFALKTYDSTDNTAAELVKPGDVILKGTCEILPLDLEKDVAMNGYPTAELPAVTGRKVEMFINDRKLWDNALPSTKFAAGDTVDLGKDIFITVCYNTGSRAPVAGAEPYGIYVKDCMVANNAGFASGTGNNRMETLTTTDGCRTTYAQTTTKAFFMESSFTESFYSTTVNTNDYNHCQSSGKLDAAKWLVGGISTIYFRCNIGFCRNAAVKSNSKCVDSCGKTNVDNARRKRDANGTVDENPYPDVAVETFIRVVNPRYGTMEEQIECVDSTMAIGTLVALIVLLLVCIGLTSMMFFKVRSRQKKL